MRGFWFTVEAILAGIILISFIGAVTIQSLSAPEEEATVLAYRTLAGLHDQGLLRTYAYQQNATAINNLITLFSLNHSVEVCSLAECIGTKPSASNVWVGTYIISGDSRYNPVEVRLYLYR